MEGRKTNGRYFFLQKMIGFSKFGRGTFSGKFYVCLLSVENKPALKGKQDEALHFNTPPPKKKSLRIHLWYIYTYIYPNVGKYTIPMDDFYGYI